MQQFFSLLDKTLLIQVWDAKRLIGRGFKDSTVQSDMKHWSFSVVDDKGKPKIEVEFKGERKTFFPEEISAMVLVKMRETAEAFLGVKIKDAVITVPGIFSYLFFRVFQSCSIMCYSSAAFSLSQENAVPRKRR